MNRTSRVVLIVIAFIVVSIALTWVWNEWLRWLYGDFFKAVATPLYKSLGLDHARVVALRLRYINFVPFVALILVTPRLTLRRRSIGLIVGLMTISASHLMLDLTALIQPGAALPMVAKLISDSFPFLVWFVVAYPVVADLIPGTKSPTNRDSGADPDADPDTS